MLNMKLNCILKKMFQYKTTNSPKSFSQSKKLSLKDIFTPSGIVTGPPALVEKLEEIISYTGRKQKG